MDLLTTLPKLMRATGNATITSIKGGALLFAHLALCGVLLRLAMQALSRFPTHQQLIVGFVVGALMCMLTGWHLALVELATTRPRRVTLADVQQTVGHYIWDIIGVAFLYMIARLILVAVSPAAWSVFAIVAAVVLSPIPEIIVIKRLTSIAAIRETALFMQENWPEWLALHVIFLALFAPIAALVGPLGLATLIGAFLSLGPELNITSINAGALDALPPSLFGALHFTLVTLWLDALLIARMHLARALNSGSRRTRAWKQRL